MHLYFLTHFVLVSRCSHYFLVFSEFILFFYYYDLWTKYVCFKSLEARLTQSPRVGSWPAFGRPTPIFPETENLNRENLNLHAFPKNPKFKSSVIPNKTFSEGLRLVSVQKRGLINVLKKSVGPHFGFRSSTRRYRARQFAEIPEISNRDLRFPVRPLYQHKGKFYQNFWNFRLFRKL